MAWERDTTTAISNVWLTLTFFLPAEDFKFITVLNCHMSIMTYDYMFKYYPLLTVGSQDQVIEHNTTPQSPVASEPSW